MTEYLTEQEQIQQIKSWVKQYGLTIIAGIVLAAILAAGWHYWQNYQYRLLSHASRTYDEMLMLRAQNNAKEAALRANKLVHNFRKTPYAIMAALLLARDAVLKKNFPEAIKQLNWVIDHSKDASTREIARIRLARIYIAENKPDTALDLLKKLDDKNFMGLIDEVRGDAYMVQANVALAREAYQRAIQELPNAEETQPILEMKFDNLATEKNTTL